MRRLSSLMALHYRYPNILLHRCRRRQIQSFPLNFNFSPRRRVIHRHSYPAIITATSPFVQIYYPRNSFQTLLHPSFLLFHRTALFLRSRPRGNAPTIQNPELPGPPAFSLLRSLPSFRRHWRTSPEYDHLDSMDQKLS